MQNSLNQIFPSINYLIPLDISQTIDLLLQWSTILLILYITIMLQV